MTTSSISTPCKLNLYLKTVAVRANGYHEIESLFFPLFHVADTLKIEFGNVKGISFFCPSGAPSDNSNLAVKAAKKYAEVAKILPEWKIHLIKNIPISAGMGGGSSDAAAVLMLLNNYYNQLDSRDLLLLAANLGADIPFFLNPAFAKVSGIGEIIEELPSIPPPPLVVLNPQFPVSAKWAYTHLDRQRIGRDPERLSALTTSLQKADWKNAVALMHNDLEYALLEKFPLYSIISETMTKFTGLKPMITGSGSSIFTLCSCNEEAAVLRIRLKERFPQFRIL